MYLPFRGSSTSSTWESCRLTRAQSSTSTPASFSMYTTSRAFLPTPTYSKPQSSHSIDRTTGSINASSVCGAVPDACRSCTRSSFLQTKNGHTAHPVPAPVLSAPKKTPKGASSTYLVAASVCSTYVYRWSVRPVSHLTPHKGPATTGAES